jgi:hypothetical protein
MGAKQPGGGKWPKAAQQLFGVRKAKADAQLANRRCDLTRCGVYWCRRASTITLNAGELWRRLG